MVQINWLKLVWCIGIIIAINFLFEDVLTTYPKAIIIATLGYLAGFLCIHRGTPKG